MTKSKDSVKSIVGQFDMVLDILSEINMGVLSKKGNTEEVARLLILKTKEEEEDRKRYEKRVMERDEFLRNKTQEIEALNDMVRDEAAKLEKEQLANSLNKKGK